MSYKNNFTNLHQQDSIIMFSTADWDNPFWTNKQHMAVRLAEAGFKVFYIESLGLRKITSDKRDIWRIFKRILKFFKGARQVRPQVWVYSPLVLPLPGNVWAEKFNQLLLLTVIKYYRFKLNLKKPIGWTYNPMVAQILKRLNLNVNVYHSVDDLTAAPRLPKAQIEIAEIELLDFADIVFVTSRALADKYQKQSAAKIYYYPNVADFEHFQKALEQDLPMPSDLAPIAAPRVGFIGAISSYKLDFAMISEAADLSPRWNWVLIGKVGEGDPTTNSNALRKNNIHLLGPRSYSELPAYLRYFDVVVIPSPMNDYTKAMFPMKFFEYLAAGKVIVSTPLPALAEFKSGFLSAENAPEMVQQIQRVLSGEICYTAQMKDLAQENTWGKRLERMLKDIDQILES